MKILKRNIDKSGSGFVFLLPQDEEDLWHIYNLIAIGDAVRSGAVRKVTMESKTGSVSSEKKLIFVTVKIEQIEFFGEDHLELTVKGRNAVENKFVPIGQYQTIKFELGFPVSIIKTNWDQIHFDILKNSANNTNTTEVVAMVLQEGVAHLCFIQNSVTLIKSKIEKNIPRKKTGVAFYEKAMNQFFEACLSAIINFCNFSEVKVFIIASPGFVKDNLWKYINDNAESKGFADFKTQKAKFVLAESSNGYKDALNEVLADPALQVKLKDTRALTEHKIMDEFFKTMKADQDKVCYGPKYVFEAVENKAVKDLMITDTLFRTKNLALRKKYVRLINSVRDNGGEVYMFSSKHHTGERLDEMSGIAAILRYPLNLDYLDEVEDARSITSEEQKENDLEDQKLEEFVKEVDIEDNFNYNDFM